MIITTNVTSKSEFCEVESVIVMTSAEYKPAIERARKLLESNDIKEVRLSAHLIRVDMYEEDAQQLLKDVEESDFRVGYDAIILNKYSDEPIYEARNKYNDDEYFQVKL
jgi:hypothetical protein